MVMNHHFKSRFSLYFSAYLLEIRHMIFPTSSAIKSVPNLYLNKY